MHVRVKPLPHVLISTPDGGVGDRLECKIHSVDAFHSQLHFANWATQGITIQS